MTNGLSITTSLAIAAFFVNTFMLQYNNQKQLKGVIVALAIKDNKVVYVAPPKKLTAKEKKILEDAPVNHKLIKRATSRKYNVV